MTGASEDRALLLSQRLAMASASLEGNLRSLQDACARLQATQQQIYAGRSRREALQRSAYARLEARLESLPLIEQAKGILMAQTGCGPDQAFDMLRRASQRSNIRVRELARQIVHRTTATAGPQRRPDHGGDEPVPVIGCLASAAGVAVR